MLKKATIKYLKKQCHSLAGKTVVVTGANSGIGLCATEELLFLGAKVIMACRNRDKAMAAKDRLLMEYPDAELEIRELDLASSTSITHFVEGIERDHLDIDAFVHNAGVFKVHGVTEDGEDVVMGTNYTGTRMLAEKLLPYLETLNHEVKMTFTTSISYRIGIKEQIDDYGGISDLKLYATSKLRLTNYAQGLAKQLKESDSNVRVILTHPGIAITPLANKAFGNAFMNAVTPLGRLIFQSTEKSALAIPYVLTNITESGAIYGPKGFLRSWGEPGKMTK